MQTTMKRRIAVLGIGAMAALSQPALADNGSTSVKSVNPGTLKVLSNGQSYTKLDLAGTFKIVGRIEYSAGVSGFIKKWTLEPVITHGFGIAAQVPGASFYKTGSSYANHEAPNAIGQDVQFALSPGTLEASAISMCEHKATSLRHKGQTDSQIFGKDQQVSFEVSMKAQVQATGPGKNNQSWSHGPAKTVKVICSRFKGARVPAAVGGVQAPLILKRAVIKLKEIAPPSGACKVQTTTSILAAKGHAQIKYRYVQDDGQKTNVLAGMTDSKGKLVLTHSWDIANGPGPETGWFKVEGVSPKFETNKASYSMNCAGGAKGYQSKTPKHRLQSRTTD